MIVGGSQIHPDKEVDGYYVMNTCCTIDRLFDQFKGLAL